jgi:hypothetical protein
VGAAAQRPLPGISEYHVPPSTDIWLVMPLHRCANGIGTSKMWYRRDRQPAGVDGLALCGGRAGLASQAEYVGASRVISSTVLAGQGRALSPRCDVGVVLRSAYGPHVAHG